MFRGGDVSHFIEEIGGDIDLLVLDTAHVHPMETLNFLCVLPFMKKSFSWTVLHDITLFARATHRHSLACRYLYGHVVAEEKITPEEKTEYGFSNIGAFKISENTMKYSDNLFESLLLPWGMTIQEKDLNDMDNIIKKYYSENQFKFFHNSIIFQKYLEQHPRPFIDQVKTAERQCYPRLHSTLRSIKKVFLLKK